MNFDLVLSNPPYNGNIDLKILQELKSVCTEMVIVHPSTWLIDLKNKEPLYKKFKTDLYIESVELFNGNYVFDIGLTVPCMITHINVKYKGNINVNFFGDSYKVTSLDDITKFGVNWQYQIKPFMNIIKSYIAHNGHLRSRQVKSVSSNTFTCQLNSLIGNAIKDAPSKYCTDAMYTMVLKTIDTNKGVRKPSGVGTETRTHPIFEFNTECARDNFLNYLQSDFARFCVSLFKNKSDLNRGELEIVPYLDFSQEWNDAKLFKFFDIDQETQDYIRNFLPDYHKIRN